jgi:hypothetical protein
MDFNKFFLGFFTGSFLFLFADLFLYPFRSDDVSPTQVGRIISDFGYSSLRSKIEGDLLKRKAIDIDSRSAKELLAGESELIDSIKVTDLGLVAIRGLKGHVIVFVPSIHGNSVSWCRIAGPIYVDSFIRDDTGGDPECIQTERVFCLPECQGRRMPLSCRSHI